MQHRLTLSERFSLIRAHSTTSAPTSSALTVTLRREDDLVNVKSEPDAYQPHHPSSLFHPLDRDVPPPAPQRYNRPQTVGRRHEESVEEDRWEQQQRQQQQQQNQQRRGRGGRGRGAGPSILERLGPRPVPIWERLGPPTPASIAAAKRAEKSRKYGVRRNARFSAAVIRTAKKLHVQTNKQLDFELEAYMRHRTAPAADGVAMMDVVDPLQAPPAVVVTSA
ncbi:hypothetical protein HDU96_009840 [Phlyctochytrium bullatum]|nr:hypothetical protein HDU96_009840 [Phlyctochytrium bullatum]